MNKFVKGAKNLAFALSFVTVAACGGVKKADLEALEKKINDKFDGVAKDGKADSSQGYVRKNDIQGFVKGDDVIKQINGEVDKVKKEVVSLDVLKKAFVKDPINFVKNFGSGVSLSRECFKDCKVVFSDFGDNGACKYVVKKGDNTVVEFKGEARLLDSVDFDVVDTCVLNGAIVDWNDKSMFFESVATGGVKFAGKAIDVSNGNQLTSLICLLKLGLKAEKTFDDLKFSAWNITDTNSKIGAKGLLEANAVVNKELVDVLNEYKKGCCTWNAGSKQVTLVGNMGWTTDGSSVIGKDAVIAKA